MSLTADRRRLLINGLKWGLFALVLAAVAQQGWKLWGQVQHHEFEFRPIWCLPAAVAYLASWLFNFWYWNVLLVGWGLKSSSAQVARAYYCGHLGKYLPGKAAVVLIRTAMLRDSGLPSIHIVASIFYETLAAIAAGAALAVALAPYVFPPQLLSAWLSGAPWLLERPWLFPVGVLLACLAGLPIITRILGIVLGRLLPRGEHDVAVAEARQAPSWGFFVLMLTWWLQGLSLGFTIQSVSAEPFSLADWPAWTGATCVANVLGFVAVFAPAGLGVREGALMEILGPQIGPTAVVAAVLLRIVCLVSEVLAALALYYGLVPRKE